MIVEPWSDRLLVRHDYLKLDTEDSEMAEFKDVETTLIEGAKSGV